MGSAVKSITKPISIVLDKIVPNEIKPALPFVSAALPFFAPGILSGIGGMFVNQATNPILARMIGGGITNLISQGSQEGAEKRGISPLSLGISAATSGLSAPGAADALGAFKYVPEVGLETGQSMSFLDQARNIGIGGLQEAAKFLNKGVIESGTPITGENLLAATKAAAPGEVMAASEMAYNKAQDALDKYNAEQSALGQMGVADQSKRRDAVIHAMQLSGFGETDISSALGRLGLAEGGIGYQYGGGAIGYEKGGLMSLGGREMDFRDGGGFVPIGRKERADDVPARLSKNEFVFTAKAVRNAGGGDIKKGAKKMYQIMKQLEARA
jgi:hypothetical protein